MLVLPRFADRAIGDSADRHSILAATVALQNIHPATLVNLHSSSLIRRFTVILHDRFVDCHGRFCHEVHGLARRKQGQLLEAHADDDVGNGVFDLLLQSADNLLFHRDPLYFFSNSSNMVTGVFA